MEMHALLLVYSSIIYHQIILVCKGKIEKKEIRWIEGICLAVFSEKHKLKWNVGNGSMGHSAWFDINGPQIFLFFLALFFRSCTDCVCCILFVLYIVGMIALGIVG